MAKTFTSEELAVLEAAATTNVTLRKTPEGEFFLMNAQTVVNTPVNASVVAKLEKAGAFQRQVGRIAYRHHIEYRVTSTGRGVLKANKLGMWREQ